MALRFCKVAVGAGPNEDRGECCDIIAVFELSERRRSDRASIFGSSVLALRKRQLAVRAVSLLFRWHFMVTFHWHIRGKHAPAGSLARAL